MCDRSTQAVHPSSTPANPGGLHPASWQAAHVAKMVCRPTTPAMSPQVSRATASSRGWAFPVSVGMDLPQPAQTVRSVRFPSARTADPLVGMAQLSRFPDHVQSTWVPVRGRVPDPCNSTFHVRLDQGAIASHPPPDEQSASIATTPKVSADVPARKPNQSASDLAEKRRTRRAQDPHVTEAQELIVFRVHLHDTP